MAGTRTTIVKVQLPLASNESQPQALVYDEGRSFTRTIPVTRDLRKKMAGAVKKFFYATLDGEKIEIGAAASFQGW